MLTQYSLTPGHGPWKKFILTGGALCAAWWPCPPFTWNNSISLGLNLFILTLITPPGLNVTSAIPRFICSVGPGNQFMLLDPDVFFAPSFVVGSLRYPYPSLCRLILINLFSCRLKMARKARCPDTPKGMKKPGDRGGSTHQDMNIGLFKAEVMQACIDEIKRVEGEARLKNEKPKKSRNQICKEFGLSPSTVSKRMTGKVRSMGPALGGARRGKVFTAGRFQATYL